jgi:hypothetical protein
MTGTGRTVIAAGGILNAIGVSTDQANRALDNAGTVNVAQGALTLNGQGTHNGDFSIAGGSTLIFGRQSDAEPDGGYHRCGHAARRCRHDHPCRDRQHHRAGAFLRRR